MSNEMIPLGRRKKPVYATLLAGMAVVSTAQAQDDESPWKFELTPYIWAAGIDTKVTVGPQTVTVNKSFSDVLKAVDIAADLLTVVQYKQLVLWAQLDYLSLNTDQLDNSPARGKLESDNFISTTAVGYQFPLGKETRHLDVLLGVRNLSMKNTLTLNGIGRFSRDKDFTDPLLILRPSLQLSKRWRLNPTFSYGTGGDSQSTYELQPQFQYQMTDHVAFRIGYRKLFYDIKADNGNRWHGSFEGAMIGLGGNFGYSPRPAMKIVATPPPPPPPPVVRPPPPPPPKDTDGDGIPDTKDVCPNTPAGEKVDAVGCSYDRRINVFFEHDSATLNADSFTDLDALAAILKKVPTMTGMIEGHTDSTGTDAYNLKLSDRRAKAVLDYLVEHGVPSERLQFKGYGETQPVADNKTAEGRAQNRRVVLHRTDR